MMQSSSYTIACFLTHALDCLTGSIEVLYNAATAAQRETHTYIHIYIYVYIYIQNGASMRCVLLIYVTAGSKSQVNSRTRRMQ
jgi:hypothetical protein